MKIDKNRFYSLLEVQKITGIKSRQYISKYIREGLIMAIVTGEPGPRQRYGIKGAWLSDFIKRYKSGDIKKEIYMRKEREAYIRVVLNFCEEKEIKTLEELKKYE